MDAVLSARAKGTSPLLRTSFAQSEAHRLAFLLFIVVLWMEICSDARIVRTDKSVSRNPYAVT